MQPDQPAGSPRRRLVHRLPVSLRQHWKILAVFAVFVTVMATVFGGARIAPQITGDTTVIASDITDNISGTVDLFDTSVSHEVSLDITDAEYQDMITTFQKTGDKKWVTADLSIDGTFVNDVSIRLKGNSTLMGVRGKDAGPGGEGGAPGGMQMPAGENPMAAMQSSADDPTSLPLLISFDENQDGRAYQGMTQISVRPGTPVLNEAMALSLTADTGQATQRYTYTVYSINDSATTTRLLLEHPDDGYANSLFESDGYLYKADAKSRFEYRGDDQSDYSDQFKQINAGDSGNLQPIINFLKWMDSADDAEFAAHLADWVDVDSLARYLATQNLLANGDDMGGPGQNYYLWYDLDAEKFTVVSWDLNLAMMGGATAGPHDEVSMGLPGKDAAAAGDAQPAGGQPEAAGSKQPPAPGGGGPQHGNPLKERFLSSDAFTAAYESAYWELFDQIYGSGRATELLNEIGDRVPVSDGLSADKLRSEVDELRSWIDQRTSALEGMRPA